MTGAVPQSDHFHIALDPAAVVGGYVAHRRRFSSAVATVDADALGSASRCSDWSVADVLRHGCDVDQWMRTIWAGSLPFEAFDPRVTPHEQVVARRSRSDAESRDDYVVSARQMAAEVDGTGPETWGLPSISYVGAVPWWQGLLHAMFDSWVHERDVLLPLGLPIAEADDEVASVLAYVLALIVHASRRLDKDEAMDAVVCGFRVTASEGPVVVTPAAPGRQAEGVPVLTGERPGVIDALSGRGDLADTLSGDNDVVDRLGFLARYFTTPV